VSTLAHLMHYFLTTVWVASTLTLVWTEMI